MALTTLLFDLGGTLLHYHDSEENDPQRPFRRVTMLGIQAVMEQVARSGARLPAPDEVKAIIDRHIGQAYRALLETMGGGSVEAPVRAGLAEMGVTLDDAQWAALRPRFYSQIETIVSPRVGAAETLASLRDAGFRLGLISNTYWAADLHDRHLAAHGLLGFFPNRLYSCDMPHSKPHPSIFNAALDRIGALPSEAAYIGDRLDVDVAGAQQAGMRGVLIRSPYDSTPLDHVVPDAIIDELPDLLGAVKGLQGEG